MTTDRDSAPTETLGEHGEPCSECAAPLAADQRYCLDCGRRRAGHRVPFMDVLMTRARRESGAWQAVTQAQSAPAAPAQPGGAGQRFSGVPILVAAGVAAFALVLGLGVLIGSLGEGGKTQVASSPPQVIRVAAPAAAAPAAPAELTGDWPEGKNGFTVELRSLPKDGTEVAAVDAAKTAASSKGAPDVGALDSDAFSSLDPGSYVIYSGVFDSRKRARKELSGLKRDFPDARVIEVSSGGGKLASEGDAGALSGRKKEATVGKSQLKELEKLSPDQYEKKSRKLPDTTKLPGKAPPKDEKKPGGGSKDAEVIE